MNWPWRTVSSLLSEQLVKAEARAIAAEAALVVERRERIAEVRHILSMALRRNGTYPLPPTETEKVEVEAVKRQRLDQPPKLTADQEARLAAVREYAKANGFTEEEAYNSFMSQLGAQVEE